MSELKLLDKPLLLHPFVIPFVGSRDIFDGNVGIFAVEVLGIINHIGLNAVLRIDNQKDSMHVISMMTALGVLD
jgi:hypothetical protein